jgi:hypothetical protein
MSDPHVEALYYILKHLDRIDYADAGVLEREEPGFSVRIVDGRADVAMKSHHATAATARTEVEPFLRAWELSAALEFGVGHFEFIYDQAKIVDRASTPETFPLTITSPFQIEIDAAYVRHAKYPDPPPDGVAVDETVTKMAERFKRYRFGRTSLGDAANYCLTELEKAAGGRKGARRGGAARRYSVDKKILDKIGELADGKGGSEARKAKGAEAEFTVTERHWLEETMKRLMWRAAEVAGDPSESPQMIMMADLPPLS